MYVFTTVLFPPCVAAYLLFDRIRMFEVNLQDIKVQGSTSVILLLMCVVSFLTAGTISRLWKLSNDRKYQEAQNDAENCESSKNDNSRKGNNVKI
jgi:hypothetical protein